MQPSSIIVAHLSVRILRLANRAFLFALLLALPLSFAMPALVTEGLLASVAPADASAALTGSRLLMLIGLAIAASMEVMLPALAALVASALRGEPFLDTNVARIRAIAWSLLALQALELPAIALRHAFPELGTAAPSGDVSVIGWLAVVLLFALAQVFARGATMQDDLAGTI